MKEPSVRGVLFEQDVEDVWALVESRRIRREELERRLDADTVARLDRPVLPASWVPVRIARQLVELLLEVEGGGETKYLVERGARNARQMFDSGRYPQLRYLIRSPTRRAQSSEERARVYGRDLELLATMSASCFDFGTWQVRSVSQRGPRFAIDVEQALELPDVLCWCTQGFMNWMAMQHHGTTHWVWRREAPDHVVFSMTRSL